MLQLEAIIQRARRNKLLQLAHNLVLLSTTLLIVMAVHFMKILGQGSAATLAEILFLIGVLLVGTQDGLEIINLSASILMAAALIPYGIQLIGSAL